MPPAVPAAAISWSRSQVGNPWVYPHNAQGKGLSMSSSSPGRVHPSKDYPFTPHSLNQKVHLPLTWIFRLRMITHLNTQADTFWAAMWSSIVPALRLQASHCGITATAQSSALHTHCLYKNLYLDVPQTRNTAAENSSCQGNPKLRTTMHCVWPRCWLKTSEQKEFICMDFTAGSELQEAPMKDKKLKEVTTKADTTQKLKKTKPFLSTSFICKHTQLCLSP